MRISSSTYLTGLTLWLFYTFLDTVFTYLQYHPPSIDDLHHQLDEAQQGFSPSAEVRGAVPNGVGLGPDGKSRWTGSAAGSYGHRQG